MLNLQTFGGTLPKASTIAIDGYAATGKSTVAALLAQELGYFYFDTGVMYRTVTWAALEQKIDPNDVNKVSELAENLLIEVKPGGQKDGRQFTVLANGRDVTWQIRRPEVDAQVSRVSSYPRVRAVLTQQQRRIASAGAIVMAGRDIGTVVLPEADLKIFLEASIEERARRRYNEAVGKNQTVNYDNILEAIVNRDEQDRTNPVSPTIPAKNAILVNTDNLSITEVVEYLKQLVMSRNNGHE
jgi:cytidylate kinase